MVFQSFLGFIKFYDVDLPGLALVSSFRLQRRSAGHLFAVAIDSSDPVGHEVFEILVASAKVNMKIGAMGRHVTRALLLAGRERDGTW